MGLFGRLCGRGKFWIYFSMEELDMGIIIFEISMISILDI
jgi:hypothetical protein